MPGGLDTTSVITLDSIAINTTVDGFGHRWYAGTIVGWGSPAQRSNDIPRVTGDGDIPVRGTIGVGAYTVSCRVEVIAGSQAANLAGIKLARERWFAATNDPSRLVNLTVADPLPATTLVHRASEARWRPIICNATRAVAEVSVTLISPDPRRYDLVDQALVLTSGAAVAQVAINDGSGAADPVLEVLGPTSGTAITISNRGQPLTINLSVALTSTQRLVVDFARRRVEINGVSSPALVAVGARWWQLSAGRNLLSRQESTFDENDQIPYTGVGTSVGLAPGGFDGRRSLNARITAATNSVAATTAVPAPAVQTYTGVARFRRRSGTDTMFLTVQDYTSADSPSGALVTIGGGAVDSSTWLSVRGTYVTSSAQARIGFRPSSVTVGDEYLVDRLGLFYGVVEAWRPGQANLISYSGGGTATLRWRNAYL